MTHYAVYGTSIGENGINYGPWMQMVTAPNEEAAKSEAIKLTKGQGNATAHICEVTDVRNITKIEVWR